MRKSPFNLLRPIQYSFTFILIQLIFLLVASSIALGRLQQIRECPRGWVQFEQSCYKFLRAYDHYQNASFNCETLNSRLVSVNNFEENEFILDWLQENDPYKRFWLTSAAVGFGQNNWQWAGDSSKFINNNDLWLPTNATYDRMIFNGAAYAFSQEANKWGLIRVDNSRSQFSYICELPITNSVGNRQTEPYLDYGQSIQNKSLIPRGPVIVVEPKDIVFDISGRSYSNHLKLRCVADAYPAPTYTWYKEDHSAAASSLGTPINPLDDERLTQTDGTLMIFNPNQPSDKGKYYCVAANQFGKVISQTVSITFGYILEFNKRRSVERGKENWGKSLPCDPPQHHTRVLYYWSKADFTNLVQQDRRVFISYDGNLYFSSLEKIDRANYSCQIQSLISSTGRIGPSFPLIVEPASNGQKLQFANGFPKSFPETPMAGQDIRLECMAYGYPTPYYNWTRSSPTHSLPKGYSIQNDGKVLIIPKASIQDEGEYVCKATSENDFTVKSIKVTVQASPRFTVPLEDQTLGQAERLVWECEAFGLPKVSYSWFKDGEELTPSTLNALDWSRYSIKENKFIIDSVQRERDAGMYQCRATNQYGTSFSSAQLRIMNVSPRADKDPLPISINAMVEQNVTIPCYVDAVPKPTITWRREGYQLDGSRMKVTGGLLQITRARISDTGIYDCIAENPLGAITTKTMLVVKPAPVIVDPLPRREIIKYGDPLKVINCEIQSDYGFEVAHVWLKNGMLIDFEDPLQGKYFKTDSGQLIIKNVTYQDQANYTCQARTSIGYVERSGTILVRGPPDACGSVTADSLTQSSARVSWTDGADHMARIIMNTIEGRTDHNSSWVTLVANITAPTNLAGRNLASNQFYRKTYLLDNLLIPWSIYEFRVAAINEYGQGPFSAPSPKYRTEMSAPRHSVSNLRGGGGKAGTLMIRWDALPVSAWGAPEIWYQVYYRLNGTYEWTKRELSSANGQTDAHTVNVGTESYYKLYDVMVQPINHIGAGPVSQVAYIRSAQQMPRVQPTNIYGLAHNSTALNVTWSPMSLENDESGKLTGYRIRYWPNGKDPQTHSLINLKHGLEPWGLVVGLQPDTEYHVAVMAYNEAGSGPESESFRVRTFKSAPQRAPTSVNFEFIDDTTVRVTWRGVAPITTNEEPVLGYKVRYWRYADEPMSAAKDLIKKLDGSDLSMIIKDLVPGEIYKLRVLAFSAGGDGKMSSPEQIIQVKSMV